MEILLLNELLPFEASKIVKYNLTVGISTLEIAEKLDAGITGINDQSVIDMQDFIENYIKGIEMLEDTQDITSTTSQVLDHIRRESQTIESWCPEAMQEIKENKAIVPKEKLLQKGLTV